MSESVPDVPRKRKRQPDLEDVIEIGSMSVEGGWLWRTTESGAKKLVANGYAWITREIQTIRPDLTVEIRYEIFGRVFGRVVGPVLITIDDYDKVPWHRQLSPNLVIEPGPLSMGHFKAWAQQMGIREGIKQDREYGFTGWYLIDGEHRFLHAGGGLGADGNRPDIVCRLPNALRHYEFPDPLAGDELRAAFHVWMQLLELAPLRTMAPLLAAVARAILGPFRPQDAGLAIIGITGTFKSELAAIIQGHFGAGFNRTTLPLSMSATPKYIEAVLNLLKDVVAVLDEMVVEGNRQNADRMQASLTYIQRLIGNVVGRGSLDSKRNLQEAPQSQAFAVLTGETMGSANSGEARVPTLQQERGDVDPGRLSEAQDARDGGVYAAVAVSFIQHHAGHWSETRDRFHDALRTYQAKYRSVNMGHARISETVAALTASAAVWIDAFHAMGAINDRERAELVGAFEAGILEAGMAQAEQLSDSDPVDNVITILRSALSSGNAHLADRETGGEPPFSPRYGWRPRIVRKGFYGAEESMAAEPRGDRVGWVDHESDSVYLDPVAMMKVVSDVGRSIGININLTQRALGTRFLDRGVLKSFEPGRSNVRVMVCGTRFRVFHFRLSTLFPQDGPSTGQLIQLREEVA